MQQLEIAKLFPNGGSQAIRLPKKFSFPGCKEVYVHKCGNKLIIEPIYYSWEPLLNGIHMLPDDLTISRDNADYGDKDLF